MKTIFWTAAAALALSTASICGSTSARADGMPYCISGETSGDGSSIGSCNYMTFRQCQRTVRNTGRSCVQNPYYAYNAGSALEGSYNAMEPVYPQNEVEVYQVVPSRRYYGPGFYGSDDD